MESYGREGGDRPNIHCQSLTLQMNGPIQNHPVGKLMQMGPTASWEPHEGKLDSALNLEPGLPSGGYVRISYSMDQ